MKLLTFKISNIVNRISYKMPNISLSLYENTADNIYYNFPPKKMPYQS